MQKAMLDRLIDFTGRNAELIADQWYQAIMTNPRTTSFKLMPKEGCLLHATSICRNLGQMYFADNCYQAVEHFLDVHGFVEDYFARSVPLEEVIYALILLRRHIWLCSDNEAIWNPVLIDMYQAVESNNRVLLIFDYATYIVTCKYKEMGARISRRQLN